MFETPESIGPFRILDVLGEGGMGIVYAAEQRVPVRRRVALKVIKVGMDTKEVLARFEAERQALAMLDQPNIAKVLEAGATESGRPWFAMEVVRGLPITRYCDVNRLTIAQRLALVQQACAGLQHAHERGILHRDVKPSNLLVADVDGRAHLKIIDFGLAKAINQRLTERTVFTEEGRIVGTPEYMSPEQAEMSGLDVDQRTDVFSLGVVLYELLAGALPFDPAFLREKGYYEIQRIIREEDPPTPSKRLSNLANQMVDILALRRCGQRDLLSALRGGLEAATMTAMAKLRNERYASCRDLADDLGRFQRGEPVLAAKGRTIQAALRGLRRSTQRNATRLAAGAVVVLAGLSLWLAGRGGASGDTRQEELLRERDERIRTLSGDVARLRAQAETSGDAAFLSLLRSGSNGGARLQRFDSAIEKGTGEPSDTGLRLTRTSRAALVVAHRDDTSPHFRILGNGDLVPGLAMTWGAVIQGKPMDVLGIAVDVETGVDPRAGQAATLDSLLWCLAQEGALDATAVRSEDRSLEPLLASFRSDYGSWSTLRSKREASATLFDIGRTQWSAAAPNLAHIEPMVSITRLTLHHSAVYFRSTDLEATLAQVSAVQRDHMEGRGYGDIGYHFLVDLAGRIIEGRSLAYQGAHTSGEANLGNIGICLLGNFLRGGDGQEPTEAQLASLRRLLDALRKTHGIAATACHSHADFKATECPGPPIREWLAAYIAAAGSPPK